MILFQSNFNKLNVPNASVCTLSIAVEISDEPLRSTLLRTLKLTNVINKLFSS
jgi:L-ribulose-5-phosphate 3-epimerase UlaE